MKQTNRHYGIMTALAAAGLMTVAGSAQANFLVNWSSQDIPFDTNTQNGPVAGEFNGTAFDHEAEFLSRLDQSVTEDFESGFSHDDPASTTAVGEFWRNGGIANGTGTNCSGDCSIPKVFDQADDISNTGRYNISGPGTEYYLDSNDIPEMIWSPGQVSDTIRDDGTPFRDNIQPLTYGFDAPANALGFYLMDPTDQGATFRISTYVDNVEQTELFTIGGGESNGKLYYLSAIATTGNITDASLLFGTNSTADGFGVDDVTVGVPAPGMLAMLGSGLMALGLFGRRRRDRFAH